MVRARHPHRHPGILSVEQSPSPSMMFSPRFHHRCFGGSESFAVLLVKKNLLHDIRLQFYSCHLKSTSQVRLRTLHFHCTTCTGFFVIPFASIVNRPGSYDPDV